MGRSISANWLVLTPKRDFFGNIRTLRRIFGYPSSMRNTSSWANAKRPQILGIIIAKSPSPMGMPFPANSSLYPTVNSHLAPTAVNCSSQTALKTLVPGFTALKDLYQGPKSVRDWTFYDSSNGQYLEALAADATAEEVEKKNKKLNQQWRLEAWDQTFEAQTQPSPRGKKFRKSPKQSPYGF